MLNFFFRLEGSAGCMGAALVNDSDTSHVTQSRPTCKYL
jgi:hypothetical protein